MIVAILGVGGPAPQLASSWDFWLPAYMILTLVLTLTFVTTRVRVWTGITTFAGGTIWAWVDNALGVLPAAAVAVFVAICVGAVRSRVIIARRLR